MALNTVSAGRAWLYSHNIGRNAAAGMGFSLPVAVAPAKNGILYVANRATEQNPATRISKIHIDQEFITEFGRNGREPGQFTWLSDVALDRDENVYAVDEWLSRVSVFDSEGNLLNTWGEAGEGEGQFAGVCALVFDADDNLWTVSSRNSRIQKFTKDGKYLAGFGKKGNGPTDLDQPYGITIDGNGDLYIADWNNHRVQKFNPDGTHLLTFGHGLSGANLKHPTDVAVDGDGDVYVVDWMNERVVIFDKGAKPLAYLEGDAVDVSKWGQLSLDANPDMVKARRRVPDMEDQQRRFRMPVGVAFDQTSNRLIVTDTQRGRLQVYEKDDHFMDPQFNL